MQPYGIGWTYRIRTGGIGFPDPVTDTPAIATTGLTKHYGDVVALDRLDLTVERGEVFGFLGPNGAGKSTTVKLLLGLIQPTAGNVRLLGESLADGRKELLQQIGAMVEAPAFYPYLSGRENLVVLAKMTGIDVQSVDDALQRVGLTEASGRKFSQYSMGMKQRLAIGAALLRRPSLVLLDEPTSGLDPAGQREIRALIPQLVEDGCTVFLSSHMMHEVQEICDRVGILSEGRLVRTAPIDQLVRPGSECIFEISVDNLAPGLRVLSAVEWVSNVVDEDGLLVVSAPVSRAADINRLLAENGVYASEIRQRERTLEDVFFEAVSEDVA